MGEVGGALAVQVGQHDGLSAGLRVLAAEPEEAGDLVDRQRAVERAAEREVRAVGAGETGERGRGRPVPGRGEDGARRPEADDRVVEQALGSQPQPHSCRHVVPRPRGHRDAGPQSQELGCPRGQRSDPLRPARGDGGQQRGVQTDQLEQVAVVGAGACGVPAGARGVARVGSRRAREALGEEVVGSRTAAARSAVSGSCSRSHCHLVAVMDATGTDPVRSSHAAGPPRVWVSATACGAERVSFHSIAGLSGRPAASRTTRPCCCPATAMPATADGTTPDSVRAAPTDARSAFHQLSGSDSRAPASPRTAYGVRGAADGQDPAAVRVDDRGLRGLRRAVHTEDYGRGRNGGTSQGKSIWKVAQQIRVHASVHVKGVPEVVRASVGNGRGLPPLPRSTISLVTQQIRALRQ